MKKESILKKEKKGRKEKVDIMKIIGLNGEIKRKGKERKKIERKRKSMHYLPVPLSFSSSKCQANSQFKV